MIAVLKGIYRIFANILLVVPCVIKDVWYNIPLDVEPSFLGRHLEKSVDEFQELLEALESLFG